MQKWLPLSRDSYWQSLVSPSVLLPVYDWLKSRLICACILYIRRRFAWCCRFVYCQSDYIAAGILDVMVCISKRTLSTVNRYVTSKVQWHQPPTRGRFTCRIGMTYQSILLRFAWYSICWVGLFQLRLGLLYIILNIVKCYLCVLRVHCITRFWTNTRVPWIRGQNVLALFFWPEYRVLLLLPA